MPVRNDYTYIDFFSGCGGLSLGLGLAGWNGLFAIEKDRMAYATFKRNLIDENAPYQHFTQWPNWLTKEAHSIEDVLDNPIATAKFEELSHDLLERCKKPVADALKEAGLSKGEINEVVLVGGSTDRKSVV